MISNRKELDFYIAADRMMNRGTFHRTWKGYVKDLFLPDYIMEYLTAMRKCCYFNNCGGG